MMPQINEALPVNDEQISSSSSVADESILKKRLF
jgi:hypothetical protein